MEPWHDISLSAIVVTSFSGLTYSLSWRMFHVHSNIFILLLLGGVFHICLSDPFGL